MRLSSFTCHVHPSAIVHSLFAAVASYAVTICAPSGHVPSSGAIHSPSFVCSSIAAVIFVRRAQLSFVHSRSCVVRAWAVHPPSGACYSCCSLLSRRVLTSFVHNPGVGHCRHSFCGVHLGWGAGRSGREYPRSAPVYLPVNTMSLKGRTRVSSCKRRKTNGEPRSELKPLVRDRNSSLWASAGPRCRELAMSMLLLQGYSSHPKSL
jgi:hypothetical protein